MQGLPHDRCRVMNMSEMNKTADICENVLKRSMEIYDLPGLAIGVSRSGEHWTGVAGVRDITTGDPLNVDDVFHCASVSKLFTSAGIMKLIDEGISAR